ncbi:MAG: hypothetical protein ACI4SF_00900 [Oscillospiraceae bacterium]
MNKILKTSAVMALAAMVFSLSGCINYKKLLEEEPGKYVESAAKKTASAIAKQNDSVFASLIDEPFDAGTTYVEINNLNGSDISVFASGDEEKVVATYGCTISSDSKVIDWKMTADTEKLVGAYNNNAYYINYADFDEKLDKSIFAPNSGSAYALDEDGVDDFKEGIEELKDKLISAAKDGDSEDAFNDYTDRVQVSSSTAEITVNDVDVEADIISYNIDSALFDDMAADYYKKSMGNYMSDEDWAEYEQELRDSLDMEMTVDFNINSKSHMLMSVDANFVSKSENDKVNIDGSLVFGAEPDKYEKISLEFSVSGEDGGNSFTADIFKSETNGDIVSIPAEFTVVSSGETKKAKADFGYSKSSNEYSLNITDFDGSVTVAKGTLTADKDNAKITLNSISNTETGENLLKDAVVVLRFEREPAAPVTADKAFLDISEEEFGSLQESVYNDMDELINSLLR